MIISLYIEHLEYLHPEAEGLVAHGASLTAAALLQRCARDGELEAMEIFLPPHVMAKPAALADAARMLLPPERAGQGFLRFLPIHGLPEIWADRQPRILLCLDPLMMKRMRYLRDRFALGPMAICCDTHTGDSQSLITSLTRLAAAEPVSYDAMVCLSNGHTEFTRRLIADLKPEAHRTPFRIECIPRAVDIERFSPVNAGERCRSRLLLGLPERGRIVLFFGRLTAYTKADLLPLVEAFIAGSATEDYLLIVGREYPGGYAALLQEAGKVLGHRLIIRSEATSALRSIYYAASDMFVLPGDTVPEAFGNTTLEAMASGLPVIVSDWPAFAELVESRVSGIVVPTWFMPGLERVGALSPLAQPNADHLYTGQSLWIDAAALTAALDRLLRATVEERVAMGAAGRRRAEAYTPTLIHARWRQLWTAQLAEAAVEDPAAAVRRRAGADWIGQPSRFLKWYGHYATGIIGPTHRFRLNERGHTVAVRALPLRFYDDLLPLIHRDIIDALIAVLSEQRDWATCDIIVTLTAARCTRAADDVRFHLGLLLKRGLLDAAAPTV